MILHSLIRRNCITLLNTTLGTLRQFCIPVLITQRISFEIQTELISITIIHSTSITFNSNLILENEKNLHKLDIMQMKNLVIPSMIIKAKTRMKVETDIVRKPLLLLSEILIQIFLTIEKVSLNHKLFRNTKQIYLTLRIRLYP